MQHLTTSPQMHSSCCALKTSSSTGDGAHNSQADIFHSSPPPPPNFSNSDIPSIQRFYYVVWRSKRHPERPSETASLRGPQNSTQNPTTIYNLICWLLLLRKGPSADSTVHQTLGLSYSKSLNNGLSFKFQNSNFLSSPCRYTTSTTITLESIFI